MHSDGASPRAGSLREATQGVAVETAASSRASCAARSHAHPLGRGTGGMMRMRYAPRHSPQKGMWASLLARRRPPQPRPDVIRSQARLSPRDRGGRSRYGRRARKFQAWAFSAAGLLRSCRRRLWIRVQVSTIRSPPSNERFIAAPVCRPCSLRSRLLRAAASHAAKPPEACPQPPLRSLPPR